jgi:hypothetical protein
MLELEARELKNRDKTRVKKRGEIRVIKKTQTEKMRKNNKTLRKNM